MPDPSCIRDLRHSSWQCLILNPPGRARDRTCFLMDTSRICFCFAAKGTPCHSWSNGPSLQSVTAAQRLQYGWMFCTKDLEFPLKQMSLKEKWEVVLSSSCKWGIVKVKFSCWKTCVYGECQDILPGNAIPQWSRALLSSVCNRQKDNPAAPCACWGFLRRAFIEGFLGASYWGLSLGRGVWAVSEVNKTWTVYRKCSLVSEAGLCFTVCPWVQRVEEKDLGVFQTWDYVLSLMN